MDTYAEPVTMHSLTMRHGLPTPSRQKVQSLQSFLAGFPQIENNPQHYFADGMYVRNLPIAADSIVVGKIHRHQHVVALIKGSATINTDRGMETISAPHIWISEPGAKRALYTHTDCEFMTMHLNPTNTKDLEVLELDIIEPEDCDMLANDLKQIVKENS